MNEDLPVVSSPLYGVADGMGGHVGGDVAARTAVDSLEEAFHRQPTAEGFLAAVQQANRAVWERGRADPDLRGMGTTLTAAALLPLSGGEGDRLVLVNVGDSRAYRLSGGSFVQLTTDHTVAEELAARGELTPAEAASHPQRHILTRVLGVAPEIDIDAWELVPREGDRYLFCSDGLSNELDPDLIASILESVSDPQRAAEELVQAANEEGGSDNVTAVVVDVESADGGESGVSQLASDADGEAPGAIPLTHSAMASGSSGSGTSTLALERSRTATVADTDDDVTGTQALDQGKEKKSRGRQAVPSARSDRRQKSARSEKPPRLITSRTVLFVVAVVAVLAVAWGLVRWYLDNSYFLTVEGSQIVVAQGKPGGFLWFDPKVVDRTGVTTSEVPANQVGGLKDGVYSESSAAAARAQVRRMVLVKCDYDQGAPGATSTTVPQQGLPPLAQCPTVPTANVTPPPTTTTTSTSTTTTEPQKTTTTTASGGTG